MKPGSVVVATKWFPLVPHRRARSASTIGTRLSKLDPYPIDLYQIHQPLSFSPVPAQMKEMAKLLSAGKIRAVGVSNFTWRAWKPPTPPLRRKASSLASNQMRFNLLDRLIERNGVLDRPRSSASRSSRIPRLRRAFSPADSTKTPASAEGVTDAPDGPTLSPAGLKRTAPLIDELRLIARAHGVTIGQAALSWTVNFHKDTVVAIPGATKPGRPSRAPGPWPCAFRTRSSHGSTSFPARRASSRIAPFWGSIYQDCWKMPLPVAIIAG